MDKGACSSTSVPDVTVVDLHTYLAGKDNDAIIAAIQKSPIISDCSGGNTVFQLTPNLIVKRGCNLYEEAERTREVWNFHDESIHVPQIYRYFEDGTVSYLIMEYINGYSLDHIPWECRSELERYSLVVEVVKILIALSKHTSEQSGPVEGYPNWRLFSPYGAGCELRTTLELENWLAKKLKLYPSPTQPQHLSRDLVMCHMDISLRNIIKDSRGLIWFIDWAYAGYYPAEFEVSSLGTNSIDKSFCCDIIMELQQHKSFNSEVLEELRVVQEINTGRFAGSHLLDSSSDLED